MALQPGQVTTDGVANSAGTPGIFSTSKTTVVAVIPVTDPNAGDFTDVVQLTPGNINVDVYLRILAEELVTAVSTSLPANVTVAAVVTPTEATLTYTYVP